jgi:hypothetical protein
VTALLRALDTGQALERAWRLTRCIGPAGLVFFTDLPFEVGRPVELTLGLPDDPEPLVARAVVSELAPAGDASAGQDDDDDDPMRPRPRALTFINTDDAVAIRARIDRYVRERKLLP